MLGRVLKQTINANEEVDIESKVNVELNDAQCRMVRLSIIINPTAAIFVVWMLSSVVSFTLLSTWFAAIFSICLMNFVWSYYYEINKYHTQRLKIWRHGYHFILALLCVTWGSVAILFPSQDVYYQLFIITFLQIALVAFNFGAMTDFTSTVINTISMLAPFLVMQGYIAFVSSSNISWLSTAFIISLSILGIFLLLTTYIGSRLIRKFFQLLFENVLLSKKLENMNRFLEERVKERTVELEKSLKLVTYQATHDLLTDLPNQRLLIESLQAAIKASSENEHGFAVVLFSLNEIEKINDGLGFQAGDLVIQTIAERLRQILKVRSATNPNKTRYRVMLSRKDIFVILLDPLIKPEEVDEIGFIFSVVDDPIYTGTQAVKMTASMGVSMFPRDGRDIQTLLMNADAAMLRSKQIGGNHLSVYNAKINANLSKQLEIERNLHNAVKNNEFIVQYQPFVSLETGEICGAEALVRWHSPILGFISPDNFIALAEANGLIIPIGEWVLKMACIQARKWHEAGHSLRIAINLSAKQLLKRNIVQTMMNILKETEMVPGLLELELTESTAFQDEVLPSLKELRSMGFYLSIDDFGTGYSGLTNLKQLAINTLKIDKSFVQDIDANAGSQAIVANTINLGKKINVTVLAEGVEHQEQVDFLKKHNCDLAQGYYFSPPLSAEDFTKLLKENKKFIV